MAKATYFSAIFKVGNSTEGAFVVRNYKNFNVGFDKLLRRGLDSSFIFRNAEVLTSYIR